MTIYLSIIAACVLVASLPRWLPGLIIRARMAIFTLINGAETLQLPDPDLSDESASQDFRRVYSDPAVTGRSRGAALSDLFWYWLAPGPEMHQEHLEQGPRYQSVAALTKRILAVQRQDIEALIDKHLGQASGLPSSRKWKFVRLRDYMMPLWASFYFELVFHQSATKEERKLIVDNANDVVSALKCCSLRHMTTRDKLTRYLIERLRRGDLPWEFPAGFTIEEQAFYLQGTFFNTAIVQMSEAMAHLLMVLASHRDVQQRMADNPNERAFYDHVLNEALRFYPLFGIAHRITTAEVTVDGKQIKKGSVVCFNYPAYHQLGFDRANEFQPQRWERCPLKNANHIPFGISTNRPCPAGGVAVASMRHVARRLIEKHRFATKATHTRSLPNRGPCLITPRDRAGPSRLIETMLLQYMRLRDAWEDVFRSIVQLVLGTIMVLDARRLRLCERYFAALEEN